MRSRFSDFLIYTTNTADATKKHMLRELEGDREKRGLWLFPLLSVLLCPSSSWSLFYYFPSKMRAAHCLHFHPTGAHKECRHRKHTLFTVAFISSDRSHHVSCYTVTEKGASSFLCNVHFNFFFSYLNSMFDFSPQISTFTLLLFVFFLSAPFILSCFILSSISCRIQSARSQFSKPQLGTFPLVSCHSTNSVHAHKQKDTHTFPSFQRLLHLQVWIHASATAS